MDHFIVNKRGMKKNVQNAMERIYWLTQRNKKCEIQFQIFTGHCKRDFRRVSIDLVMQLCNFPP